MFIHGFPAAVAAVGIALPSGCAEGTRFESQTPESQSPEPHVSPACVPAWNVQPVDARCGIFVSSSLGDDNAEGSPSAPVRTLAQAISIASPGASIYACAEDFHESIKLPAGSSLFGGLDCTAGFRWIDGLAKSNLVGAPDEIALTLSSGAAQTRIEDLAVYVLPAQKPGGSSIAMIADHARAELTRCAIYASQGADGESATSDSMAASDGAEGLSGAAACGASNAGGARVEIMCEDGSITAGGKGGDGGTVIVDMKEVLPGENGSNGEPETPDDGKGRGGLGQTLASWSCAEGKGSSGKNGAHGLAGNGATGIGSFDVQGYVGIAGAPGAHGLPGQGGGGGGGARGGLSICGGGLSGSGAGGGSGGAGGCGGKGGRGGRAGGGSIGLISLDSQLLLADSHVKVDAGGRGGDGADGQIGGLGGFGGLGGPSGLGSPGCAGGMGGQGGNGGPGGGGLGGPAIPIVHSGAIPELRGNVSLILGMAGPGGLGGNGNLTGNSGAPGMTAKVFALD